MDLKPFDLERALTGSPVMDDAGDIGYYKLTNIHLGIRSHIFQFSVNGGKDQCLMTYKEGVGWYHGFNKEKCCGVVTMAPVKRQEWMNIYKSGTGSSYELGPCIHSSKEEAVSKVGLSLKDEYITTVLIREWEE